MKYEPIITDMRFSNQLHLALYGETLDERQERVIKENKKEVIKKLLVETDLSDEKIAKIVRTTVEFVKEVKANNQNKLQ